MSAELLPSAGQVKSRRSHVKPRCPYCSGELEKDPTRKTKCPHCSQYIFVRRGKLLTEQQAQQADEDSKIERWIASLETFGGSRRMFDDTRKRLSKSYGFEAPPRDAVWGVMNALVAKQADSRDLERLYFLMGVFVKEEGKDPAPYIQEAMRVKEAAIRQEVTKYKNDRSYSKGRITIQTCNDENVCKICRKAASHTYKVDEFVKKLPIPALCESPDGCRCWITWSLH